MHTWFAGMVVVVALWAIESPAATDKCDEADTPEKGGTGALSREATARQVETVRAQLAGKMGGLTTNEAAAGVIAAALVNKNADASEPESMRRLSEAYSFYKPLVPAIRAANVPDEFKYLLEAYYASIVVFPIRQGHWGMDAEGEAAKFASIPAGGTLVAIGEGQTLTGYLDKSLPAWKPLNAVRRKILMDYLDGINPHVSFEHMYRARGAAVQGEVFTCELMDNLLRAQMYGVLESINPAVSPFPPSAPGGKGRGECIAVPIGGGDVVVSCYRVEPSAKVFLPPAAHLVKASDPDVLDLRNTWLRDLSGLVGMHPKSLDLSGCMVTNLRVLSAMQDLVVLRLTGNPVADLSPLKGLKLRELDIGDTWVKDLTPLAGMPLERLVLKGARVTDISPLAKIGTLRKLELSGTAVTNIAPLSGLPLEYLTLVQAGNYVELDSIRKTESLKTIGDVPLDRWITENEFLRAQTAAASSGPASAKTGKKPGAPPARLGPPPKKKDEEPPDVIPSIDLSP